MRYRRTAVALRYRRTVAFRYRRRTLYMVEAHRVREMRITVFAILPKLCCVKNIYGHYYETDELPNPRPTQPKANPTQEKVG